jgi:hypothetical protein
VVDSAALGGRMVSTRSDAEQTLARQRKTATVLIRRVGVELMGGILK